MHEPAMLLTDDLWVESNTLKIQCTKYLRTPLTTDAGLKFRKRNGYY